MHWHPKCWPVVGETKRGGRKRRRQEASKPLTMARNLQWALMRPYGYMSSIRSDDDGTRAALVMPGYRVTVWCDPGVYRWQLWDPTPEGHCPWMSRPAHKSAQVADLIDAHLTRHARRSVVLAVSDTAITY